MSPHAKNDDLILAALAIPGWYEERVAPKIRIDANGCWVWSASRSSGGYAQVAMPAAVIGLRDATCPASRVVWIRLRGEIPADHVLDHDGPHGCSNRACVRPGCLQVVTIKHNISVTGNSPGAVNARKERCPKGHDLTGHNLMPSQVALGRRECLACNRDHAARRNEAVREARHLLGLKHVDYARMYGLSRITALCILAAARLEVAS